MLQLSQQLRGRLDALAARYPTPQAACLPALHAALAEHGQLSAPVIEAVAQHLGLPLAHVYGVASFYTMFRAHRATAGPNVLRVCTNVSCMLRGAYQVLAALEAKLGIKPGETSPDGFTLIEDECLAACADAPAMVCGDEYFLELTPEKVEAVLAELRAEPHPEAMP